MGTRATSDDDGQRAEDAAASRPRNIRCPVTSSRIST